MNRLRISISLMVLTIAAIVLFQAYWLRKSYVEENRLLTLRAHLLFRETLFKLQATKLHLDTSFNIRMPDPSGVMNMASVVQRRLLIKPDSANNPDRPGSPDSLRHSPRAAVFISVSGDAGADRGPGSTGDPGAAGTATGGIPPSSDTGRHTVFYKTPDRRVAEFLTGVDSLQDSVTVKEVNVKFRQVLDQEGIRAPFSVMVTAADRKKNTFYPDDMNEQVILGFSKPRIYQLQLGNTFWLTARRLAPQALFSIILVGVTICSFLLLYRNWQRQRKLIIIKNDFISNITHELKTPIATVSVAVEAMKSFNALQDPVRTREYLDISTHELQRLSLLVDKVLKLSLFERQEIELKREDFNLKLLVEEVMASMRLQFEKYQAKVDVVSTDGGEFRLKADKLHFSSVIYNLLDNALKYSRLRPVLRVDLAAEQHQLVLAVTDNGIGIPAAYQDRVFEKFFRVPTGDQHNVKGYGLGLSYVAYVVQRQGGEIMVDSKEGIGSRFTVKIPRGYA